MEILSMETILKKHKESLGVAESRLIADCNEAIRVASLFLHERQCEVDASVCYPREVKLAVAEKFREAGYRVTTACHVLTIRW